MPTSAPSHSLNRLLWLEAMRAFAAIWVLLHHAIQSVQKYVGELGPEWLPLVNGSLGVDFFFVLSGFIIALSCERLAAEGSGLRAYARARVLRIYLPYLPVGITMLALYLLMPALSDNAPPPGVLTSLTLLPSNDAPALSVAWTLVHEVLFYALFSLFFVSRRLLAVVFGAWVAAILVVWQMNLSLSPFATYFLSPVNLCFIVGVGAFYATRLQLGERSGVQMLVLGLLLVFAQAASEEPSRVIVTLGFLLIVMAAGTSALQSSPPAGALIWLGAASYSIYLIHKPALAVGVRLLNASGVALSTVEALGVVAAGSLLAGVLYYLFWERGALRYFRERQRRSMGWARA